MKLARLIKWEEGSMCSTSFEKLAGPSFLLQQASVQEAQTSLKERNFGLKKV